MNVYDFDGTIFYSDCSIGFALWCLKRHPKLWFTYLPGMIKSLILHKMGKLPNYLLQRKMFSYLTMIDDFDIQIEHYWDKYENRISDWYLAQKRPDDLIISASPDCVIGPIAKRLGEIHDHLLGLFRVLAAKTIDARHGVLDEMRPHLQHHDAGVLLGDLPLLSEILLDLI